MSRIDRIPLFVALLAVAVVGCKDSTTEPAEPLTMEETEALYFALSELARDTAPEVISTTSEGAVFACAGGGQVTAMFDIPDEMVVGDTVRLDFDITIDPEGCVMSDSGYMFTVDGNPNVRFEFTMMFVGSLEDFLFDGSMTGGVDWQLEDRSGTCLIDLTTTMAVDLSGPDPQVDGSTAGVMCGLEVEFDANVRVPGT